MLIIIILGILMVNSQNRIHSTVQKFTWGVHASTVNITILIQFSRFTNIFL